MSSSNSPCAACKCLRRKCTQECVFAPYFPPDNPQKFSSVHKVFGASNVAKLLNDLPGPQREDAVNSLAYEAESRLRDPVYGCVGLISLLQQKLKAVQQEVEIAKKELSHYVAPGTALPLLHSQGAFLTHQQQFGYQNLAPFGLHHQQAMMMGAVQQQGGIVMNDPLQQQQQQQLYETQQHLATEQEMLSNFEQQQLYNTFDESGNPVTVAGFNQMQQQQQGANLQPSLALGGSYDQPQSQQYGIQPESSIPVQQHELLQQQYQMQQEQQFFGNSQQTEQQLLGPHDPQYRTNSQQTEQQLLGQHDPQYRINSLQQEQQLFGQHDQPNGSNLQEQRAKSEEGRSNTGPNLC